jgi:hydrogenase small subunit
MACTMPNFPDGFMPFMDRPPGSTASATVVFPYGKVVKALRRITQWRKNKEPSWRQTGERLTTGHRPRHFDGHHEKSA